jgi:hypothetical protein
VDERAQEEEEEAEDSDAEASDSDPDSDEEEEEELAVVAAAKGEEEVHAAEKGADVAAMAGALEVDGEGAVAPAGWAGYASAYAPAPTLGNALIAGALVLLALGGGVWYWRSSRARAAIAADVASQPLYLPVAAPGGGKGSDGAWGGAPAGAKAGAW